MASEERVRFQLEEYYEALMSASLKEKLKPFVRQFKKKNIPFIYETLVNTIQVLTGKHELPLMKFNALMATKLFFDTAEYVPVVLIEVFLLPLVLEVALYRVQKRSEEGLTLYFTERGGFEATREMKRVGFNFVLLAMEFVFMSAQVRPVRTLESQELREESNFGRAARLLQEKGVGVENYKFYIPSYVAQTRKKYLRRLAKFAPQDYTAFFLKLICDELNLNRRPELDTRRLFVFGDAYLTIPLMHVCEDELSHMHTNFVNKKKYLALLGDFMRQGDIYAVLIVTRSAFLEDIFGNVQRVRGEAGLEAGEGIYPEVEAARADKKEFYVEFLKHVELWAHCHPVDEDGDPTDAKKICDILRARKFVFPSNILIAKIRAEMEENLKLNQKRNERLIRLVDDHSSEDSRRRASSSRLSRRSEGLRVDSRVEGKPGSYIEFDELEEMVLEAKKRLDRIADRDGIEPTMRALDKFRAFWEGSAGKNEIEADDSGDIQIVLEEGDLCAKVIEMVLPVYHLYAKGLISFEDYRDRVDILMKKEAEDSAVAQTSFQKGLQKIESSRISRQKSEKGLREGQNSRGSEAEKFEDCYEKSSLSELQSNIKPSELSLKSSCKPREEREEREERGKQEKQEKQNDSSEERKEESNISFREESASSSRHTLQKISEKESLKSESLLQEESFRDKNSFAKPQPAGGGGGGGERSLQEERRGQSESVASSRSGRSNKKLLDRRNKPVRARSKVSSQHSELSSESVHYKDAIGSRNPKPAYEDYYNDSKDSFISSQNSVPAARAQQMLPEEGSSVRADSSTAGRPKPGKAALARQNEDYYGEGSGRPSSISKGSSRVRESRPSKMSESRPSKMSSKGESQLGRPSQNRQNNYAQSMLSCEGLSSKELPSEVQPSKSSSISIKPQNILIPSGNAPNFSLLAKYEESRICEPEFEPLLHSFHEEKEGTEGEAEGEGRVGSFRECFEVNNEIILAKEGKEKLLKFTKGGKIANFIEAALPRHATRNSTIVDIISERNAKRSIESYRHLRQKSRATETLSERMKSLDSFNRNLRMKALVRQQQCRGHPEGNRVALKDSRVNGSEPVSFYNDSESSRQQSETLLRSEASDPAARAVAPCPPCLDTSRLVNPKIYSHYFPAGKSEKLRKCMLKSKGLLLKSEEFEVGCVTSRRERGIEVSLFVTPLKGAIEELRLAVMHDHNLRARLFTEAVGQVRGGEQESIALEFEVENVPYVIPTLSFKFKANRNYAHNHLLLPLPLAFTKFVALHPRALPAPARPSDDVISIEEFRFSPRLINSERTRESLANFQLLGREGRVEHYGSEAFFKGKIFELKFAVSEKGWMALEGRNMTGDHRNTKFLEFLLVTFREIFEHARKEGK